MAKKKKEEETEVEETEVEETQAEETSEEAVEASAGEEPAAANTDEPSIVDEVIETVTAAAEAVAETVAEVADTVVKTVTGSTDTPRTGDRGNRAQRVGVVTSDKMTKTVVVRVDRLIKHPKYRRYVRRKKQFMAHDELGAAIGDKVRIVETRPLSARKRWRVVEIVQKAAK
jgi:small subunit ribosomal protein S17